MKIDVRCLAGVITLGCICAAGFSFALIYRPALRAIARPDPRAFPKSIVERGAILAAIGDCAVCHTADAGAAYAGGRPLSTPFGILYATNITPDEATGIGKWSSEAFRRAMREGVSRDGRHLYPALPYEHFTRVDPADLDAIYAFLMTRRAIVAPAPANHLIFPLGFRSELAGWKLLFLRRGSFVSVPGHSDEWNRGAYLVEGLGHCGGCHTPRNLMGGEERGRAYTGGIAEGWNAPALDASNPVAATWTEASLYTYLRTGVDPNHSAAAGPMGPVTDELATVPEQDVRAISVYVASLMRGGALELHDAAPSDKEDEATRNYPTGAALFVGACEGCHATGAPMMKQGRPALSQVGAIQEDDPRNTLQAILQGIEPPARGPFMPPFADSLNDQEIADLAAYLRARYSTRPQWQKLQRAVAKARQADVQP